LTRHAFNGEVVARVPRHAAYPMGIDVYFDNVGAKPRMPLDGRNQRKLVNAA
jgi:hypothetical protein